MTARVPLHAALGVNLWLLGFAVPAAFAQAAWPWLLAPLGPAALALGLARRSSLLLVAGVPLGTLLPLALPPFEAARQSVPGFVLCAASLAAYLAATLRALAPAPAAAARKPLEEAPLPERWARRARIFRALAATAAILPALLVYAIDLHPPSTAAFAAGYPGDAERAQAFATALAGLVSATVLGALIVRPLAAHLDRDIALRVRLEQSRIAARRGRPRAAFYFAVAAALALMALVVVLRR